MRGKIIAYTTAHKKAIHYNYITASDKVRQAQALYQNNPTEANMTTWQNAKRAFNIS